MGSSSSRFGIWCVILFCGLSTAWTQGRPPGGGGGRTNTPRTPTTVDPSIQPIFISGKVLMEGGGSPGEPVAIERVCNGVARREGYTDFKGQFEIQLGVNPTFQDASENGIQSSPNSAPRVSSSTGSRRPVDLAGCEFRAARAGFQSTTVMLPSREDTRYEVGTIVLKRMGGAKGTTISLTSMAAPKDAKQSFEKGERAVERKKFEEAEKELTKAVKIYPQYAAAWSSLGDVHQEKGQLQQAREDYMKAIFADAQYVNPHFGLAIIAMQEKNWPEAVQFTGQVIQLNAAAYPATYFYNAVANYNLGKDVAAEESARRYKTLDVEHRHPDVALLLCNILTHKQDYQGAAQQLREYLALVPGSPDADKLTAQLKQLEEKIVATKN